MDKRDLLEAIYETIRDVGDAHKESEPMADDAGFWNALEYLEILVRKLKQ